MNEKIYNSELLNEKLDKVDKLDWESIEQIIGKDVTDSEAYTHGEVSKQRENSYRYYYGESLGNEIPNKSSYVSKDVMSTVEGIKALILETFEAHKNICYFPPLNKDDYFKAKEATSYCNHIFYVENKGHKILTDLSHDGLVCKTGIMKVFWEEKQKIDEFHFVDISEEEYKLLKSDPTIEILSEDVTSKLDPEATKSVQLRMKQLKDSAKEKMQDIQSAGQEDQNQQQAQQQGMAPPEGQDPNQPPQPGQPPQPNQAQQEAVQFLKQASEQGKALEKEQRQIKKVYTGTIYYKTDDSGVKVEVIPPEDFLISPNAISLETAIMCGHRKLALKSDLIAWGFPKEIILPLPNGDDWNTTISAEKSARNEFDQVGNDLWTTQNEKLATQQVIIYEIYRKIDIDGTGTAQLYKFFYAGNKLLSYEPELEIPFFVFNPYPISHKFFGLSVYDIINHIQMSKTTIQRQIIDNLVLTNNPKWLGDLGFIRNVRDLIENKPGSVIDTTNIEAIKPFPVTSLSPETMNILGMIEEDKVATTGFSKLAQGIDPSAISNQNSYNLIQSQTSAGNRRPMMIAKNLAFDCLAPAMKRIYSLGKRNETKEKMIEIGGDYVPINPGTFMFRDLVRVNVALTPDEQIKQSQSLLSLHQSFIASPALQLSYGTNQQYFLFQKAMEFMNLDCRDFVLLSPKSDEYQQAEQAQSENASKQAEQADQMAQLDMKVKDTQATLFSEQAKAEAIKAQTLAEHGQMKLQSETDLNLKKNDLELRKQEHKENVDFADIELQKAELLIKMKGEQQEAKEKIDGATIEQGTDTD